MMEQYNYTKQLEGEAVNLNERIGNAYSDVKKVLWIILVPIFLDMVSLLTYIYFLKGEYIGINKLFILKLGAISAPPNASYIIENFPSVFLSYSSSYGTSGLIMTFSVFNVFLALSFSLIQSFLKSGYMGCLEAAGRERVKPLESFSLANKNWFKYFILQLVNCVFLFMMISNRSFIIISFIVSMLLFYTQYSIVVEEGSLLKNIKNSMHTLGKYLMKTTGICIYYGFLMSLTSPLVFPISRLGYGGLIIAMVIVNYFGMSVNKAILELYRDMSGEEPAIPEAGVLD